MSTAAYRFDFEEIKRTGWSGVMAIETDNRSFQEDPAHLVEEGKTFFAANAPSHP